MTTHEEAIVFLRERGLTAHDRTWALGRTVEVFWDQDPHNAGFYSHKRTLMPQGDGWVMIDHGPIPEESVTLDEACALLLAEVERTGWGP